MSDSAEPETRRPYLLPVGAIFVAAFSLPARYAPGIFRACIPLLITGGIFFALQAMLASGTLQSVPATFLLFILLIPFWASFVLALVGIHRVYLLGEAGALRGNQPLWSTREWRFTGWTIAISLLSILVSIPFLLFIIPFISSLVIEPDRNLEDSRLLLQTLQLLIGIPLAYFVGRWSLVLPATAVDQQPSLGWAWDISRENSWRLMVLVGLVPIATDYLVGLMPIDESGIAGLLVALVWIYIVAAEIGMLSLSYHALVASKANESPEI